MSVHLQKMLSTLQDRHRMALLWFAKHAGTTQGWPAPIQTDDGETLLASKAKGIYKPGWSQYALSVRQSLGGPYPDREPVLRADGTWLYSYFQENNDPSTRDHEYTNRGLMQCWRDCVPVGVMRQIAPKPDTRYAILGLALVSGWDGGYFFLEGFSSPGYARSRGPAGEVELLIQREEQLAVQSSSFEPSSVMDGRERVMAQIVRRRGQPEFRRKLLAAYEGRCAISGCNTVEVLEAAHITPYLGAATNCVENGLLLRADLHTLFDVGLLSVDPEALVVLLSPVLRSGSYAAMGEVKLRLPSDLAQRPSYAALSAHRQWSAL